MCYTRCGTARDGGDRLASRRAFVLTYGCQMNEHDSEIMQGYLKRMGFDAASGPGEADLVIVNTCCVRDGAEQKVYGKLGQLKALKDQNPDLFLAVGGCLPQQPDAAERLRKRAPYLDLVFGPSNLHRLPDLVREAQARRELTIQVEPESREVPAEFPVERPPSVSAWVTVITGCDNFCTFCIVPYTRGREISRPVERVRAEVEELVARGYREVCLLGQNVNSYGLDLPDQPSFARLLGELDRIDGLWRIRYTSPHPAEFTEELIECHRTARAVCEHFHLPLQSGSSRVLEEMNREYTREEYEDLVRRIRSRVPGASITTDIIVGFPGETEADFQQTLEVVAAVRFDRAHTFMFSPRRGTPAADFPDPVPLSVKRERLTRLNALQDAISLEINRELVGQEVEVFVEGPSKKDPERLTGRTRTNKIVNFDGPAQLRGTLVPVKVVAAHTFALEGALTRDEHQHLAVGRDRAAR